MSENYPTGPLAQPPEESPANPYGTPPVPHQGYDPPVGQPYVQPHGQRYAAPYGHDEMKRHTGHGLGGGLALLLAFLVGIVMPHITSSEVGDLYERAGQRKPVSGATGLWYFPGMLILIGPLVWFIQTNGALNAYWRSQGVR